MLSGGGNSRELYTLGQLGTRSPDMAALGALLDVLRSIYLPGLSQEQVLCSLN